MITSVQCIYLNSTMIKTEDQKQFKKQVRNLRKTHKFMGDQYIRILYEFCEFQYDQTSKVLYILKDDPNPLAYIKLLIQSPHKSEAMIKDLTMKYEQKYGKLQQEAIPNFSQFEQEDLEQQTQILYLNKDIQFDFFQTIPSDVCLNIMTYLDPMSFSNMACVNTHFYRYTKTQLTNEYFKTLCIALFQDQQPKLPNICVFAQVRQYVLARPLQFGQNFRNAVNNNLRYFIWKMEASSFKTQKDFYKSFGNYRNIYLHCPRVHLNGIYLCKQKYVKIGEKNYMTHTTPIHIVYYYRYIRFFEDGSLLYYVTSRKQKMQKILQILSKETRNHFSPSNQHGVMIGQYIQFKNKLYVKSLKNNTIFSYECNILSNGSKISDMLKIMRYTLEVVDQRQTLQVLYEAKPHRQELEFIYMSNSKIRREENSCHKALCGI